MSTILHQTHLSLLGMCSYLEVIPRPPHETPLTELYTCSLTQTIPRPPHETPLTKLYTCSLTQTIPRSLHETPLTKLYTCRGYQARKSVFLQSMRRIDLHNAFHRAGYESFEMEVNYFADWLPSERKMMLGIISEDVLAEGTFLHRPVTLRVHDSNASIPDTVDWRQKGAVTPVKNQGQCGSCWAFSTVGAVESQHFLATGELVVLSEQNLMDCDRTDAGCHGGDVFRAFNFMIKQGGVDTQATYPYHFTPERCHFKMQDVGATVLGYVQVPSGDEEALKRVVAIKGPVTAIMDANISLFAYKKGVLTVKNCSKVDANHGVVIIGYGREGDKDYWLVKNSWSTMWGDEGYFKIERNVNMCGIATNATYPIVGPD
ncbi:Peptidase C1A papain C-terminal [Trinorchestia longiramus]|nr:Peptidase C1A papain C-terminal [Trinorchestia longiramus]